MLSTAAGDVLFQDSFQGQLAEGWTWVREHPAGWRITEHGLEMRVEPGNMWGPDNNARNVLVRPLPDMSEADGLAVTVVVENEPTAQYEQVDLVWYYDDSHMVKIGLELVDGQLSLVMGREEADQARTLCIIPLTETKVQLRLAVKDGQISGQFRTELSGAWRDAGSCDLPVHGEAKISLQAYQGPADAEHWALLSGFQIFRFKNEP